MLNETSSQETPYLMPFRPLSRGISAELPAALFPTLNTDNDEVKATRGVTYILADHAPAAMVEAMGWNISGWKTEEPGVMSWISCANAGGLSWIFGGQEHHWQSTEGHSSGIADTNSSVRAEVEVNTDLEI